MMMCNYCGSENTEYRGIDDGGGDYGDSICDVYHCHDCDMYFDADCWGDEPELYGSEEFYMRLSEKEKDDE